MISLELSVGAVFGVLLSVILAHRLAIKRESERKYTEAVTEFKNILVPLLKELEYPEANPSVLVTEHYPDHDIAMRQLAHTLPNRKKIKLQKAWSSYTELYKEKKYLGSTALIAAIVDDLSKAHDPKYIYEQNTKRRLEVSEAIINIINEL